MKRYKFLKRRLLQV